jgi:hypothetical protein
MNYVLIVIIAKNAIDVWRCGVLSIAIIVQSVQIVKIAMTAMIAVNA